jgi:hypothetical protein
MELSQCIFWYRADDLQYEQDEDHRYRRDFLTKAIKTLSGLHHLDIYSESPYYLVSGHFHIDTLLEIYPINGKITDIDVDEKRELRYCYDQYPLRLIRHTSGKSEKEHYYYNIERTSKGIMPPLKYLDIYSSPNQAFVKLFPEPKIGDKLDEMSDEKRVKLIKTLEKIGYFRR